MKIFLVLTGNVVDYLTLIHHYQAVPEADGILHVVCYHHCSDVAVADQLVGQLQHFGGGLRVKRCGVLVEKKYLRVVHC